MDIVELSRLQFALTAMYHFLFVPLTLGLAVLLAIMESVYVTTGRTVWRDMTRFWGTLFGINFALGVATGITMEFEFGTNWSRFSQISGGVIGQPLAMEGVFSFFLESAFLGLFLYGEKHISKRMHWFAAVMIWPETFLLFASALSSCSRRCTMSLAANPKGVRGFCTRLSLIW